MAFTQDFSVFTPEIWSPRVSEWFRERLIAADVYTNRSEEIASGGDTIRIAEDQDDFTAKSINTTSGAVSARNISDTQTTLSVDKWQGDAFIVTHFQDREIHSQYNFLERKFGSLAHAIARKFDSDLLAEWSNFDTTLGDSTTDLTSTNLEKAFSILESNSVPKEELTLLIHPRQYWGDIFKRSKYYDASQFGQANLPNGMIGTLYGTPVRRTEQIPASNGSLVAQMVHPEAVHYALGTPSGGQVQQGVRLNEITFDDGELRNKITGDIAYGLTSVRTGAAVAIKTNNNR